MCHATSSCSLVILLLRDLLVGAEQWSEPSGYKDRLYLLTVNGHPDSRSICVISFRLQFPSASQFLSFLKKTFLHVPVWPFLTSSRYPALHTCEGFETLLLPQLLQIISRTYLVFYKRAYLNLFPAAI